MDTLKLSYKLLTNACRSYFFAKLNRILGSTDPAPQFLATVSTGAQSEGSSEDLLPPVKRRWVGEEESPVEMLGRVIDGFCRGDGEDEAGGEDVGAVGEVL